MKKLGKKEKRLRDKRLPDEDALLAIAEIFALGEENLSPRDIFTTSTITLLLSAPARGSEPLYLEVDCLVYGTDKDGNPAVGLKWYSGKFTKGDEEITEKVKELRNLYKKKVSDVIGDIGF